MHFFNRGIIAATTIVVFLISTCLALDPFTLTGIAVAGLSGTIFTAWQATKCRLWECCGEPWLLGSLDKGAGRALRNALEDRVYGQHIAIELITQNIRNHLAERPSKPLVLSFHGGTGVGKNHVTRVLAETMFRKGMTSKFVHLIIATRHFPYASLAADYRVMLQGWIRGNLTKCSRNLFIFDEVDKIPAGVLDGISSFLEYYGTEVDGVDQRAAIFIFLSNAGCKKIDEIAYEAWESGKTRESLTIFDFQRELMRHAFNEETSTGFFRSDVISRELIDIYVPFLPLERRHVEGCVRDYLREHNYTLAEDVVSKVADELDYWPPPPDAGLFSTTGCKRIRERVVGHSASLKKWTGSQTELEDHSGLP
ncbi:Torsin-1A [Hypsibius exemplaris]|uniref:Torsin-1A n=1 Tax=Hypsibius exemplaris TaxID=2072580 RepID=A0A9X6NGT4_HYPEX|nr:Torsin-1A [Hypsibius exemplaris]